MSRFLKSFAIAAGRKLGCSVVSVRSRTGRQSAPQSARKRPASVVPAMPDFTLQRLETLEARLCSAEPVGAATGLSSRLSQQDATFEDFGARLNETQRKSIATFELVTKNINQLRDEVPVLIEMNLAGRIARIEARLQADAAEHWTRSAAALEEKLDRSLSDRISALATVLLDQSESIADLRKRADSADASLQRLALAIDRLTERETAPLVNRQVAAPVALPPPASPFTGFLPQFARQSGMENRAPRVPIAVLFGALMAFGFSRFLAG